MRALSLALLLLAAACGPKPPTPESLFEKGLDALYAGAYGSAVLELTRALKLKPSAPAYYFRGLAHYELRNFGKALEDWKSAGALDPKLAGGRYERAVALFELGRSPEALTEATAAVAAAKTSHAAYYLQSRILLGLGLRVAALSAVERSLAQRATYPALLLRARLLDAARRRAEALETYGQAVALRSDLPPAYIGRAGTLGEDDAGLPAAVEDLTTALKLAPSRTDLYMRRARYYSKLYKMDEAVADASTAINASPTISARWAFRGAVYRDISVYDKDKSKLTLALADLAKAVELNPRSRSARGSKANAHMHANDNPAARAEVKAMLTRNPRNGEAFHNLCLIEQSDHAYALAYEHCSKAVDLEPHSGNILAHRCSILLELARLDDAKRDCDLALEYAPGDIDVFMSRGRYFMKKKQRAAAAAEFRAGLALNPRDTRLKDQLAQAEAP